MPLLRVLWIILLALFAFVTLALWWPVMLSVEGSLALPKGAEVTLNIRFFSGLIRLKYRLKANLYEKPPLHVLLYHGKEEPRVLWRPGQEPGPKKKPRTKRMALPLREIWRHVDIRRLRITGELGIKDDAFYTAMLSGLLSSTLQAGLIAVCADKKNSEIVIDIAPQFSGDSLRLNLEGIAGCSPIHIISAILIWHLKNRKGQATVWHILSKTS